MNTDRRSFLSGAVATAVLPGVALGKPRRDEFPILMLELCGKYPGDGSVYHLTSRRMVTVDLEVEDDWGDVNEFVVGSELVWGLGNDVDGYWRIERVFEVIEPREDLHEDKFPMACELSQAQFAALMAERIASWT